MSTYSGMNTLEIIDSMSSQFTKTDWKIVKFIKRNPEEFLNSTAVEIANEINTSDASIIRFSQKIGFNGLNEFKIQFKKEMTESNSLKSTNNSLYSEYQKTLSSLFTLLSEDQLQIFSEFINNANTIYICAFKQYNFLANVFVERFLYIGINVTPITNSNSFKLYAANAQKDDLFIILNLSDEIQKYEEQLIQIKKDDANVIVISDRVNTQIKKEVDQFLMIPKKSHVFLDYSISKSSLVLILFDILFNEIFGSDIENKSLEFAKSIELTQNNDKQNQAHVLDKLKKILNE